MPMTPSERALLLAVAKYINPERWADLAQIDGLIAAVELEAEKQSELVKSCRTCLFNDGGWCRATMERDCISPNLELWQPHPLSAAQYSNDRIDNKS